MQFDPLTPEFRRNPYPYYDQLRTAAPIFFWEPWGVFFLTRWADCNALLRDSRLGHGEMSEPAPQHRDLTRMQTNWMLFQRSAGSHAPAQPDPARLHPAPGGADARRHSGNHR